MKVVAIAQARMGSTRVPGKVLRLLGSKPVLRWTIDALRAAAGIDEIVLATSTLPADDVIAQYCDDNSIGYFRGHEADVLDRFYQCAKERGANVVIRVTCDCPFLDPQVISEVIKLREMKDADYCSNIDPPSYPDGLDVECFTFTALEAAHTEATSLVDRDCVPQFIHRNRHRFSSSNLICPLPGLAKERWVLDTEEDWEFCQQIVSRLSWYHVPHYIDILSVLDKDPELRRINQKWTRNERFYEGLATEILSPRTFKRSMGVLGRALKTIPYGAQTFSKSHIQFPEGRAPLYCTHGDGGYLFDVDGNRFVDLINAVLPVVLGYRDPDVDEAIRRQLDNGISFSLATPLEAELSELLCHYIPCAEMVKFGKSGTDVTTAAVRLARAYTGRDHVLVGGYHGWADWSMSVTDRNLGIPLSIQGLSHRIAYGDRESVVRNTEKLRPAAIIVEPNDNGDYLRWLRDFCNVHGIVLIFDEVITGFRYGMGGAQELFDVTPDLATFGKAMANGMPISALVGKKEIMRRMAPPDNIFYSGTMFGETLSIAAAIATIKKLDRCNVIKHLWDTGTAIEKEIRKYLKEYNLADMIKLSGYPPRTMLAFHGPHAAAIRTVFMAEMIQNGVLIIASNNVSYAHKSPELTRIFTAYHETLATIAMHLEHGDIDQYAGLPVTAQHLRTIQ